MASPVDLTIAEAGLALRLRSVSAVELTEAALARIAETDPVTHAWALVLPERALAAAEAADRELAAGADRGPLHGIPLGIKDICHMRGLPTEAGSRAKAGYVADADATVTRKLEEAGAVVVGKTVTHEFAYGVNTPPTRSPWAPDSYPGGSSTGSGVAVAVRAAFGAVGTDTGGSIRIPASINGIVGLKPSYGRVSRTGVLPLGTSLDHVGPLTRTVGDCAAMLQAIAGHDPTDRGSADVPVPDYAADLEAGARGLVIGVERPYLMYDGVAADVRRATEAAIDAYRAQGATIVDVAVPELESTAPVLMTIMGAEASAYHRARLRERAADYDPATRQALAMGEFIPATHYLTAQKARSRFQRGMRRVFAEHRLDALLSPTMPVTTAPLARLFADRPDRPGESPMLSIIHHTFFANLTGQPAVSIPCGLSDDGLPLGLQLLGRPFDEATVFRAARAYEREHDWTTRRPPAMA